jgi:UDP-glucose 4-epimerase
MKIVVTGALGHIGSALTRSLPSEFSDAELVLVDNLLTQRYCSLFDLPRTVRYRFVEADIAKADLRKTFEESHVVVHLAAMTDAAGSYNQPEDVEANNYLATSRVIEACVAVGARMFMPSSTSVYGTTGSTVAEDCSPEELVPQSPYAACKLKEEHAVADAARNRGLRAVTCRFGTIFGVSPGMRFHTAVNRFCWQAVMGIPLTVWQTALDQKRQYLDLLDATRALAFLIREDLFHGETYNILTRNATVREIVDMVRKFVPDLEVCLVESPIMNQLSYDVSCDRIQRAGFVFTGDLRAGVRATVALLQAANSVGR